jgi:hypothetical protein
MIRHRAGIMRRPETRHEAGIRHGAGGITNNSTIARFVVIGAVVIGAAACSSGATSSAAAKAPTTTSAASPHKKGLIGIVARLSPQGFTLTLKSSTLKVALDGSTRYKDNGLAAGYSALANGDHVRVVLTKGSSSPTAKEVVIIPPSTIGKISAVSSTGFTMTTKSGSTDTVTTGSSTVYAEAGHPASAASLHAGERVKVAGSTTSSGSIAATHVLILKGRKKG